MKVTKVLLGLAVVAMLAGCGTPDEMEADESPRSEQESVGEGEVPGPGTILAIAAVGIAGALFAWKRRR